jgi:nucleoside-diphosphate-sugar epimerase
MKNTPVIALTGATGFVGTEIVRQFAAAFPRASLRLLVRRPDRRVLPHELDRHRIVSGSLSDHESLRELVSGVDTVVHAAGAIGGRSADAFDQPNVVGTRRLLDAVRCTASSAHVIHISSLAARHPGLSWYAASKRAGEELVTTRAARYSILRPPAVYGPDDPALAGFWRLLARGWLIRLGPPAARFSLLHSGDLAQAVVHLQRTGPLHRTATLAGPEPAGGWRWSDVAAAAAAVRNGPVRVVPIPGAAVKSVAACAGIWARIARRNPMLGPGKARELLHPDWVCDNLVADSALGWRPPTHLRQAIDTLPGWTRR